MDISKKKNLNIGVIVLSRLNSSRLPGKALKQVGTKPLIKHVLDRLFVGFDMESIVLATSIEQSDDELVEYTQKLGLNTFRGSLENVAERFLCAAQNGGFDVVIRVTGDSLFTDVHIIKELLKYYSDGGYDFVSNRKFKSYPMGQTFEIVNVEKFAQVYKLFCEAEDFEHVTKFVYEHENELKWKIGHYVNPDGVHRNISLALDTVSDFEKLNQLLLRFPELEYSNYLDVINKYEKLF